jgi:hypothetical protein
MMPTFHTNLVRQYMANNDDLFPLREAKSFYDFGVSADKEGLVSEIIAHQQINSKDLEFQVRWTLEDVTWEPMSSCKDLKALDHYLECWDMSKAHDLPNRG